MPKIHKMMAGEAMVGDGNEVAHIDLVIGPRGSSAETAFVTALTNNKDGFTTLLAVLEPNVLAKPNSPVQQGGAEGRPSGRQMFGPAQYAVARAVVDSVAEGFIPQEEADDLFIAVGVFIHWQAQDDARIQAFNYAATKLALARAVAGQPTVAEVLEKAKSLPPFEL